jgi:hypothetical protein
LKTYISEVEGLLMYSPAVFLHKGQKLMAAQDTVEILQALAEGKIALIEEVKTPKLEPEPETKPELTPLSDDIPETIKPARRGIKK